MPTHNNTPIAPVRTTKIIRQITAMMARAIKAEPLIRMLNKFSNKVIGAILIPH